MTTPAFAAVAAAIKNRRTVKSFTGQAVSRADVDRCLELASWAPTHRMTQPWRFAVLDQPAIARLTAFIIAEPDIAAFPNPEKAQAKLAKLLGFLPKLGALIQVTWMRDADPEIDREEHAAAAAAIQNLLLAATALGLGSFWSTNPALSHPKTLAWCGCDPQREGHLGALWLGTVAGTAPNAPARVALSERVRYL